jgi:dihydrofolate synthase/folylpolyglutamate synthase
MYHRIGAQAYKANLDNTLELCRMLDQPQDSFKSVHVAGTNGKGSVSHMLASILQTAGYRTGLYTSPHLKDFRERIRVNGKMIPKRNVTRFIAKYRDQYELFQPSFFELTVGMAFDYFREQHVEIAVVEVGLGGRLDSTNIITPLLSVITNISFDHMQLLGDTLEKIAHEKAGIIKQGIPVVIGETQPAVQEVFTNRAAACHAPVQFADQHYKTSNFRLTGRFGSQRTMDILFDGQPMITNLISPLAGSYQQKNIQTVLAACAQLNQNGMAITESHILKGIRNVTGNTGLAGRWQVLSQQPLTICDAGHNAGGLREVLEQIASTPHEHLHFVIGVVNDKHLAPILAMLPKDATYYFCKPDIPRGLDADLLCEQGLAAGLAGSVYASVNTALKAAREQAGKSDLVFVGGSTFVVAEVV